MSGPPATLPTPSYDPPAWAGKPSAGLHLDVTKDSKLVQKLMIDEKKCYLFGRNPQMNDFTIDHGSCSRVHAALLWHKHLERSFLVDLGSSKWSADIQQSWQISPPWYLLSNIFFLFSSWDFHRRRQTGGQQTHSAPSWLDLQVRRVD